MQDLTYVSSHTVVPEDDGVRLPPSPNLAVDTPVDVVVQEVEDRVYGSWWSVQNIIPILDGPT